MRHSRRFSLLTPTMLLTFSLALTSGYCAGQVPAQVTGQISRQIPEQATSEASSGLSTDWENGLQQLTEKVSAIIAPPARVDLLGNNISALSADEVATIHEALRSQLIKRGFRVAGADPSNISLNITLSEDVQGYLVVAQIRRGADEQVAIVPVAKRGSATMGTGGVAIESKAVWEQPAAILDFSLLPPAPGEAPLMMVLETKQISFYVRKQDRSQVERWQLDQVVDTPPLKSWVRAPRGHIDLSQGVGMGTTRVPGIECQGDFQHPWTIDCKPVSEESEAWLAGVSSSPVVAGPASADMGGDTAMLALACDGHSVALATGKDDWTHDDFIQAYVVEAGRAQEVSATGSPIEFEGPVMALWPDGSGAARAVIHNLQTGNYEATIVTATCSH